MPTTISPAVFDLAKELIDWPTATSIGCFTGNNCVTEIIRASQTAKISAAVSQKAIVDLLEGEQNIAVTALADPTTTRPVDAFHMAFCYPSFGYKPPRIVDGTPTKPRVVPIAGHDHLAQYAATRFTEGSECDKHLLELEQMLASVMAGCYAFAVLPDWYMSGDMRYNRWMNSNVSMVAKIELPDDSVMMRHTRVKTFRANVLGGPIKWRQPVTSDVTVPDQKWSLVIWFKGMPPEGTIDRANGKSKVGGFDLPKTGNRGEELEWAQLTYGPFSAKLKSFDDSAVDATVSAFKQSDWSIALFQWRKTMAEASYSSPYKIKSEPRLIRSASNMILVRSPVAAQSCYRVVNSVNEIPEADRSSAVLLKPTRSGLKLSGAFSAGDGVVCRIQDEYGYDENKDGTAVAPKMRSELRRDFDTIRQDVLKRIEAAGGTAYMLHKEVRPLTRRRRRINRQLAAIPRMTPNFSPESSNKGGKFSMVEADIDEWSPVFEDIGVDSLFPEEHAEWKRRAKKSGVDSRFNFDYQVVDIVAMAMKCRVINCAQQGLGKTRCLLQAALLRGSERILIVAPSRLMLNWCEELENEVATFFKFRKNWNGKRYKSFTPNLIQMAADCRPDKLKLINIISFDTLKRVPRDACFFLCPKCHMVICKFYHDSDEPVYCPGDNALFDPDPTKDMSCVGPHRRWKMNTKRIDPETGKRAYRKFRIDPVTATEVHWDESHPSRAGLPDDHTEVVDTRNENPYGGLFGGGPDRPVMTRQEKMFSKTNLELTGFNTVNVDNENGIETQVQVPVHRRRLRKCHGKVFHVGWTYADLLRSRFGCILYDEILAIKNRASQRSMAISHVTAKVRIAATGTPASGAPSSIINYINCIGSSAVFPDYQGYDPKGLQRFLDIYKSVVFVGGRSKMLPKIKNPERFMQEFSSIMLRRLRSEPAVKKFMPSIDVRFEDYAVPMDAKHAAWYAEFQRVFLEWYAELQAAKNDEENPGGGAENVLAKIVYLISAATSPHTMLASLVENIRSGKASGDETLAKWASLLVPYSGPPTAIDMRILEQLRDAKLKGNKVIVFSGRRAVLDMLNRCCKKLKIGSMVVDGRVNDTISRATGRSKRFDMIQRFKTDDTTTALLAGIGCLSDGQNLECANVVIFADPQWEPSSYSQGAFRILRPAQKKPCKIVMYHHANSIQEFRFLLVFLKWRSHCEGTDARSYSDISTDHIPDISAYLDALASGDVDTLKKKMSLPQEEIRREWEAEAKSHLENGDEDDEEDGEGEGDGDEENGNGNGICPST